MGDTIVKDNIKVGQLLAKEKGVKLRMFYTPKILTTTLVFDQDEMEKWWKRRLAHGQQSLLKKSSSIDHGFYTMD